MRGDAATRPAQGWDPKYWYRVNVECAFEGRKLVAVSEEPAHLIKVQKVSVEYYQKRELDFEVRT
jgi:hypothetical protein